MPAWTEEAADDLEAILDYIATDNPDAAAETVRAIETACNRLDRFPNLGRPGAVPGTRELVLPRLPYLVIYRTAPRPPHHPPRAARQDAVAGVINVFKYTHTVNASYVVSHRFNLCFYFLFLSSF